jgi:hypothetical protein
MDADEIAQTVKRAEGFAMLGMHVDAWEEIETLPPDSGVRLQPAVIAVRLKACTGLRKWEIGLVFCKCAEDSRDPGLHEAAGRFYLSLAECLTAERELGTARKYIALMSAIWPDGRDLALESKALRPLWE